MAFNRTGLYCINPEAPPGARLWAYQSLDAETTVRVADYFLPAIKELSIGDFIYGTVVEGAIKLPTAITARYTTYVNANNGTTIDVVDAVVHASTDGD